MYFRNINSQINGNKRLCWGTFHGRGTEMEHHLFSVCVSWQMELCVSLFYQSWLKTAFLHFVPINCSHMLMFCFLGFFWRKYWSGLWKGLCFHRRILYDYCHWQTNIVHVWSDQNHFFLQVHFLLPQGIDIVIGEPYHFDSLDKGFPNILVTRTPLTFITFIYLVVFSIVNLIMLPNIC